MSRRDAEVVWSSDGGDRRKGRGRGGPGGSGPGGSGPRGSGPGQSGPGESGKRGGEGARGRTGGAGAGGRIRVRRETSGRRGKAVTTISDVPLDDAALRELATRLKKRCGVGGSAKDGVIELQGDQRDIVVAELKAAGYDVVLAGG